MLVYLLINIINMWKKVEGVKERIQKKKKKKKNTKCCLMMRNAVNSNIELMRLPPFKIGKERCKAENAESAENQK